MFDCQPGTQEHKSCKYPRRNTRHTALTPYRHQSRLKRSVCTFAWRWHETNSTAEVVLFKNMYFCFSKLDNKNWTKHLILIHSSPGTFIIQVFSIYLLMKYYFSEIISDMVRTSELPHNFKTRNEHFVRTYGISMLRGSRNTLKYPDAKLHNFSTN